MFSAEHEVNLEHERQIAIDTLERYSGSLASEFQPLLLLTNFPRYVEYFAKSRGVQIKEGAMFKVAHSPKDCVSIIDFKIGSPAAALVVDVCSFLPVKASLLLGMCGGLRSHYKIGDYFVPVAAIRGDGTSDFYFPPEVPAMANFLVQKAVTEVMDETQSSYQVGITHTTNKRFWEFNAEFKERLKSNRSQAIEMECATLFISSYKNKLPLGALLLISDLPLEPHGIKTKESSEKVYLTHTGDHVDKGVEILKRMDTLLHRRAKGADRDYPHP
jgi:AMP nucleosidase